MTEKATGDRPERATRSTFASRALAAGLSLSLLAAGTVACSEPTRDIEATATTLPDPNAQTECVADSIVECAPEGSTVAGLMPEVPTVAEGEPLRIGMINNDTGPAAAFPEITRGAQIAVEWINAELGGVDGRPIKLIGCDAAFSATGSQSCGQQMVNEGVPVVLGGIDIFGDGILVLEANGIPYVGGVPVSFAAVQSSTSFQFSGGSWAMNLGFVHYITEVLHAERVSIVYGEFGSVADGAEWARTALIRQGVAPENVKMITMPIVVEDMITPLSAANESDPDAIIVLVADSGCGAAYSAALDLHLTAKLFFSAACMDSGMIATIGAENVEGNIYAVESPVGPDEPDATIYRRVIDEYGEGVVDTGSAAAVGFSSMMNLYSLMVEVGADSLSAEAMIDHVRGAVDHPSFMGHPYTCDGRQLGSELPGVCAPQQILLEMRDGIGTPVTDWIEVSDLVGPKE